MAEEEKRRPPLRVPIWSSYKSQLQQHFKLLEPRTEHLPPLYPHSTIALPFGIIHKDDIHMYFMHL